MPRKLVDLAIKEVSAVDDPANRRRFLLMKKAGEEKQGGGWLDWIKSRFGPLVKTDDEERPPRTFGEALIERQMGQIIAEMSDYMGALYCSLSDILHSGEANKTALLDAALENFHVATAAALKRWLSGFSASGDGSEKSAKSLDEKTLAKISAMRDLLDKIVRGTPGHEEKKEDETMLTKEQIDKLPPEIRVEYEATAKRVGDLEKEIADLKKAKSPGEEEEDVWKGVHPKIREQHEALRKKAEQAETIAKEERDKREEAEYLAKAKTFRYAPVGKPEEFGKTLRVLRQKAPEVADTVEKILRGSDELLVKRGTFGEIGSGGEGEVGDDPLEKVAQRVEALQKQDSKLSEDDAMSRVFRDEPELYDEYKKAVQIRSV